MSATIETESRREHVQKRVTQGREQMLEFLSEAVQCASVSGEEDRIHDFLISWLDTHGWTYQSQPLSEIAADQRANEPNVERRANIVAWPRPPRDGVPTVVLNGHIDVVPAGDETAWTHPPFSGLRSNGRVYGRGAVDTKGPIAAALYAVDALGGLADSLPFDVAFQLVCAEETTGVGTRAVFSRVPEPLAAIVLEPTNGAVAPVGTGLLFFEIEVEGRSAHTSAPWCGADAFLHLMRVHVALSDLADERGARFGEQYRTYFGDIPTPVPFVVGTVTAGTWRAAVPDTARMAGRWGVAPGEDLNALRSELEQLIAQVDVDASWDQCPTRVNWQHELPGWETAAGHPLVAAAERAVALATGSSKVTGLTAGTDAAQYGPKGVPTIIYGPGDTALAHSPDEFVEEDAVELGSRVIADMLLNFAASMQ